MLRKICLITCFSCFSLVVSAQVHKHAIGLRGGPGNYGYGAEISYQLGFSEKNRLELDLGWRGNNGWGNNYYGYSFSAVYHWVWNLSGGLNWFIGPGAQLVTYGYKKAYKGVVYEDEGFFLGVGGQIGLEYDFSEHGVPLHLGLDARPMGFFSGSSSFGYGGALSIRYLID